MEMEDTHSLSAASSLNEAEFDSLLTDVFSKINNINLQEHELLRHLQSASGLADSQDYESSATTYERAFAGLCSLSIKIIRIGTLNAENLMEKENLVNLLTSDKVNMSRSRVDKYLALLERESNDISQQLSQCSNPVDVSRIVDIDWRLDYKVRSLSLGKTNEVVYCVSLKTIDCNNQPGKDIEFKCSLQQLEDLVQKLLDAKKQVERVIMR
mmetsp:Transcript_573/g.571  ORF Transcript_573/g.571 Transcript_573/m.571 type:complete len:212 (-) Transcript_573:302-937(-)